MAGILNVDQIADSSGTKPVEFVSGISAAFYESVAIIDYDHTITTGSNAMTAGPVTIATGTTITVPTGSTWTVV